MIFLTWIERRGWLRNYGQPVAALWSQAYSETDYRNALRYAAASGEDYNVHCFGASVEYQDAKAWALEAAATELERRKASPWILWPAC